MKIILPENSSDVKYEYLARYAFDIDSWGGPANVASSTFYNFLFISVEKNNAGLLLHRLIDLVYSRLNFQGREEILKCRDSIGIDVDECLFDNYIILIIEIVNKY